MGIRKIKEVTPKLDERSKKPALPEEFIEISKEFIEDNKKLVNTNHKRGGPYSTHDRITRRNEVYRLHFEHGYSSVKISEMMKINRHTIDNDIRLGYSRLTKDWENYDINGWFMRQINRLEAQRTRILDDLDKQKDLGDKLSIEKLIAEIDNKITQILVNTQNKNEAIMVNALRFLNKWAEDKKVDVRFLDRWDIFHTSRKKYAKIREILHDEKS